MEHRLFDPADPPEWLDPQWWRDRPHCNHLESETGAHVARLRAAAELAAKAATMANKDGAEFAVCDLGAGDGALLSLLPKWLCAKSWGYDLIVEDVVYAQGERGVEVRLRNIAVAIDETEISGRPCLKFSPVVVLTEVLEHMADPHGFLAKLAARPEVRYVVASSPHSETPEQHEWNHAWCWDEDGYARMFEHAGFQVRESSRVEWSQLWLFERAA